MSKGTITMSMKEVSRLEVVQRVISRGLTVAEGGSLLGISARHVKRLTRAYKADGANGLVSKHRGKVSNHKLCPSVREAVVGVISSKYSDFGPTLACEKLSEVEGVVVAPLQK